MKKVEKINQKNINIILTVEIAILAVYAALLTGMFIRMNSASEDRDNFIMERVFELQVDKLNREAEKDLSS